MKKLLLYILLSCLGLFSYAQHPYYYTIHDGDGLPSNEVYQLYQDSFGYMWLGCNSGLFRYDGFSFIHYKNSNQNSVAVSGLQHTPGNKVYCQNFSGQLFCVSYDSLVLCADVKERIRSHPAYTVDKYNNLWIGLPGGVVKKDSAGKEELLFKNELYITEMEPCADGSLYAIDIAKGVLKISKNKNKYTWTRVPGAPEIFNNSRTTIEQYGDAYFALTSSNKDYSYFITQLKSDSAMLIKYIPANSLAEFIYSLTIIKDKIWLGTSSGAYCLNMNGEVEQHYFLNEKVSDILQDRERNYWFSTLQNGLFIIPNTSLVNFTTANSSLKDNNITALRAASNNDLLIGTYSGDVYHYSVNKNFLEQLPRSKNITYRNVTTILPFDEERIIVSRGSVSVINIKSKTEHSHPSAYIRDMAWTGDSITLASSEMIGTITNIPGLISGQAYHAKNIKSIAGKNVCFDATSGATWVSLNTGLAIYEHGDFIPFKVNKQPLYCNALYADNKGIWVGSVSDGIYNIRKRTIETHLSNANGLQGNNVRCITSVHDTLYVATDVCINIYYPQGSFAYVDYTEGINAKEITSLAIAGNNLFIGTIRGLFCLPADAPVTNGVSPNILITSVIANGVEQDKTKPIVLNWDDATILINFSSVALRSRGRFSYLYRVRGLRNTWERLDGSINYVRLNHLPPGNYTFEVKAVNEDGIASRQTAAIAIVAEAPFWQQWWFYILIFILGSLIVALVFIFRIRKIKQQADIRNQVTSSQLTALKAQMNPHFMYNTLNSIQDLILQNDIKNTNYYLSRYSTLMRKILESSEHNEIELTEEIEILQLYMELEKLRFGSEFTYTISVSDAVDKNTLLPSMLVQPFVENAIKHGLLHKKGEKKLEVAFDKYGGTLICSIQDNGVGRKKAAEIKERSQLKHRSFATKATLRRLELVNLDRKDKIELQINDLEKDGFATGTKVVLKIPVNSR